MDPFGFGGIGDPMESVLSLQTFGFGGVGAEDTGTCGNTGVCGNTGTCGSTATCGSTGSCQPIRPGAGTETGVQA